MQDVGLGEVARALRECLHSSVMTRLQSLLEIDGLGTPKLYWRAAALDCRYGALQGLDIEQRDRVWNVLMDDAYHARCSATVTQDTASVLLNKPTNMTVEEALIALRCYFELHVAELQDTDPLEWWKKNRETDVGRRLLPLAKSILCVPASSAPCERLFSSAGHLNAIRRRAQKPMTLRMISEIRAHIRKMSIDDVCDEFGTYLSTINFFENCSTNSMTEQIEFDSEDVLSSHDYSDDAIFLE